MSGPPAAPAQPRFVVVVDAAHGGADSGASISEHVLEKDVVLSLSVRLRSTLATRGITVVTTRESDGDLNTPNRAGIANHATAAACISLHATASGNGVHLFTSSLGQAAASRFLPWQSAQAAFSTQSLRLSSEINSALGHADIPVMLGRTSIQPLDSLACPAVALEIAPLAGTGSQGRTQVADAEYQRRVIEALAGALQQWRNDWRQQP
jgi:N-acetylmuramoyl-L-alanine amidase